MENSLVVRSGGSSNWTIVGMGLFSWALLLLYVTDGFAEMAALISPFFLVVTALWILMFAGFSLNSAGLLPWPRRELRFPFPGCIIGAFTPGAS